MALAGVAGLSFEAIACHCPDSYFGMPGIERAYREASHVFVGKLTKVELLELEPKPDSPYAPTDRAVATFKVEEVFKGDPSVVEVEAAGSIKMGCSVVPAVGWHYIIFADVTGKAHLNQCRPSRNIWWADENPEVIRLRELARNMTSNIPLEGDSEAAPQLGR